MIDNVPLRDIKCKVNPEHVNDLLGFAGYNESSKKGIDYALFSNRHDRPHCRTIPDTMGSGAQSLNPEYGKRH